MNESDRKHKDSRKRIKTLKGRGQSKDPTNIDVPQGDSPKDDSNLIYVGGIANFHEQDGGKSFRQMREDIRRSQELQERKNSKKRRTKNPSTEGGDPRSMKIRDLKNTKIPHLKLGFELRGVFIKRMYFPRSFETVWEFL